MRRRGAGDARRRASEVRVARVSAGHPILDQMVGMRPWAMGSPTPTWKDEYQRRYWALEDPNTCAFRLKRSANNPPERGDVVVLSPGGGPARVVEVYFDAHRRKTSGMVHIAWL